MQCYENFGREMPPIGCAPGERLRW